LGVKILHRFALASCCLLSAGLCHAAERIEILLDASMGMWEPFQTGTPRIAAVRGALNALVVSPDVGEWDLEIGLRTIGGRSEIVVDSGCGDAETLIPNGPVDPARWSKALSDIDPRGGRSLVHAVEEAVELLAAEDGESRIVLLTSGGDQCQADIAAVLENIAQAENQVRIRVIGLDIERKLANAMLVSAPTKNVSDPAVLFETLQWALLHPRVPSTRREWLELHLTRGDRPVNDATLHVTDPSNGEDIMTSVVDGDARLRVVPGLHRARIDSPDFGSTEVSGIVHSGTGQALHIGLLIAPPVTIEVDPERPIAGVEAHFQYWGAPPGENWLAVTVAGAPVGEYMVRSPAPGTEGEVALALPDSPNQLEAHFTRDVGSGVHQLLGRIAFETGRRKISIEASKRIEIQTQLKVSWDGAEHAGDYLTIAAKDSDSGDFMVCIPTGSGGPANITAPAIPGDYVVRYLSRRGRSLDRANLEVFEILATLDGPAEVAPGEEFTVRWTGPDADQDFVSVAVVGENDDRYRDFSLTENGNPVRFSAPKMAGDYELRYVRAADGEVLAREPIAVVAIPITLDVPAVVEAGTRFEVSWSGSAGRGDFIAVAPVRSGPKKHFDWAYTSLGSPVSLAAPFQAGRYVVRYVSGESNQIVARRALEVR
jgi:Ca-activated chloride channel family protein